jgi:hypothetical protein
MGISIRSHCIPCFDELSRLRKVAPIPVDLDSMEEETGGGIIKKFKAVVDSDYFKKLPSSATIESGYISKYLWSKDETKEECDRIWNECKKYL